MKDAKWRISIDLQRARREKFAFAAKLVRGAYMVGERQRATLRGYDDPIQPSLDATHENYHNCLSLIFDNIDISNVMVASHNERSLRFTVDEMSRRAVKNDVVFFGQLLGMADHLSFTLGAHGYKVFKYVPYGPVHEVIPYLLRRAQENSNMLGGAVTERKLLWSEFKARLSFWSRR